MANNQFNETITINLESGQTVTIRATELLDQFERPLGEGNFGSVGRYYWTENNMKFEFAVKRLKRVPEGTRLRDAEMLQNVEDTTFIIKFYGLFHVDATYWFVLEPMDMSLDNFYEKARRLGRRISEQFLSKVAYSILKALEHLKSRNIIHRDIKPANMLINRDGSIKLCDFGISGRLENSTNFSVIGGCESYMSPEWINNRDGTIGITIKSDIWSLGISLIEIAQGSCPYPVDDIQLSTDAILDNPSPRLPENEYTQECNEFINLCLIKDPNDRADIETLLRHKFITDHLNTNIDSDFVKEIINQPN